MVFSSYLFIFAFLPIALVGFMLIARLGPTHAKVWLCIASVVFYGSWFPGWIPVLVISVLFNYAIGQGIRTSSSEPRAKALLLFGVAANLLALFYFKYLVVVLGSIGISVNPIALPLGISFFTFTQIAFLVDVSQGFALEYRFVNYVLFVTFFPHLIAGPIVHHKELMPQFEEKRNYRFQPSEFAIGLVIFIIGLAKKTLIADNLSVISFETLNRLHIDMLGAWLGALTYSMQLYFDFSGYSDMAIGLARMFGIKFPLNFNSPYKATSIIDFWQRWHMTLTRFLTAYIYNPVALTIARRRAVVGKSNSSKASKTLREFPELIALPTFVTMVLAGIWHGAGLQFVIFGALHGIYITVNHAWRKFGPKAKSATPTRSIALLYGVLVYLCVLIAEIFFRADSASSAVKLLAQMGGVDGLTLPNRVVEVLHLKDWMAAHGVAIVRQPYAKGYLALFGAMFIAWFAPNTQEIMLAHEPALKVGNPARPLLFGIRFNVGWAVACGLLLFFAIFDIRDEQPFIYFQF
ncbi:MAG: MBOAT family O-acyltransferase [Methylocella sp.]